MDKADIEEVPYAFDIYLNKVITISETCPREINYQLEIIKPFLESVFKDYQIVDTSKNCEPKENTKYPKHNRYMYTVKNGTSPDLLITKGYKYNNNKKNKNLMKIYGVIEVKEQSSYEMFNKEVESYHIHIINEIATYFCKNEKVILTNCRRWQFFDRKKIKLIDLELFEKYLALERDFFQINKSEKKEEHFKHFCERIKEESYSSIKILINNKKESEEGTEEWFYKCKNKLEKYIREQICLSVDNTIDVLPKQGIICTDMYRAAVSMNEESDIITTPREWNEMIIYLKEFVL